MTEYYDINKEREYYFSYHDKCDDDDANEKKFLSWLDCKYEKTFIYSLSDPITNEIKYVGKANKPHKRLLCHFHNKKNKNIRRWCKSLLKKNLFPKIGILDEVLLVDCRFWETYWICQIKSWGFNLFNLDYSGVYFKQKNDTIERENRRRRWFGFPNLSEEEIKNRGVRFLRKKRGRPTEALDTTISELAKK